MSAFDEALAKLPPERAQKIREEVARRKAAAGPQVQATGESNQVPGASPGVMEVSGTPAAVDELAPMGQPPTSYFERLVAGLTGSGPSGVETGAGSSENQAWQFALNRLGIPVGQSVGEAATDFAIDSAAVGAGKMVGAVAGKVLPHVPKIAAVLPGNIGRAARIAKALQGAETAGSAAGKAVEGGVPAWADKAAQLAGEGETSIFGGPSYAAPEVGTQVLAPEGTAIDASLADAAAKLASEGETGVFGSPSYAAPEVNTRVLAPEGTVIDTSLADAAAKLAGEKTVVDNPVMLQDLFNAIRRYIRK